MGHGYKALALLAVWPAQRGARDPPFNHVARDLGELAVVMVRVIPQQLECVVHRDGQVLGDHPLGLFDDHPAVQCRLELRGQQVAFPERPFLDQPDRRLSVKPLNANLAYGIKPPAPVRPPSWWWSRPGHVRALLFHLPRAGHRQHPDDAPNPVIDRHGGGDLMMAPCRRVSSKGYTAAEAINPLRMKKPVSHERPRGFMLSEQGWPSRNLDRSILGAQARRNRAARELLAMLGMAVLAVRVAACGSGAGSTEQSLPGITRWGPCKGR